MVWSTLSHSSSKIFQQKWKCSIIWPWSALPAYGKRNWTRWMEIPCNWYFESKKVWQITTKYCGHLLQTQWHVGPFGVPLSHHLRYCLLYFDFQVTTIFNLNTSYGMMCEALMHSTTMSYFILFPFRLCEYQILCVRVKAARDIYFRLGFFNYVELKEYKPMFFLMIYFSVKIFPSWKCLNPWKTFGWIKNTCFLCYMKQSKCQKLEITHIEFTIKCE